MDLYEKVLSVDMVRIKVENIFESDFMNFRDGVYLESGYEENTTGSIDKYFWNLNFKTEKNGDFWLGYKHNTKVKTGKKKYNLVIEFNPNKCKNNKYLQMILGRWFYDKYEVVRADVAIDLYDVDITNIIPFKSGKRKIKKFNFGGTNRTIYIGKSPYNVKVYNKAREQGLPERDLKWSRYEITFKVGCKSNKINKFEYSGYIPKIYYITEYDIDRLNISSSDKYIVYAALKGKSLEDLNYRRKKKVENALAEHSLLEIKKSEIENTLKKYINKLNDYSKKMRKKQRKNVS